MSSLYREDDLYDLARVMIAVVRAARVVYTRGPSDAAALDALGASLEHLDTLRARLSSVGVERQARSENA